MIKLSHKGHLKEANGSKMGNLGLIFFSLLNIHFTTKYHCFYESSQTFQNFGIKSLSFGKIPTLHNITCKCKQYFWILNNSLFYKFQFKQHCDKTTTEALDNSDDRVPKMLSDFCVIWAKCVRLVFKMAVFLQLNPSLTLVPTTLRQGDDGRSP